jgi:hypothetical protein
MSSSLNALKTSSVYTIITAYACIVACIGGFSALFIFGAMYPGYSHLKDTISYLGMSASPVSDQISTCWIIVGVTFVFFGTGFNKAFSENRKYVNIASLLIILYGLGDEIGSGAFKADLVGDRMSTAYFIHDTIGGIGVTGILLLPLIMQKIISKDEMPGFHKLSKVIFLTSIIMVGLFLFRFSPDQTIFLAIYKGIWQRMFALSIYTYFIAIAVVIIKMKNR